MLSLRKSAVWLFLIGTVAVSFPASAQVTLDPFGKGALKKLMGRFIEFEQKCLRTGQSEDDVKSFTDEYGNTGGLSANKWAIDRGLRSIEQALEPVQRNRWLIESAYRGKGTYQFRTETKQQMYGNRQNGHRKFQPGNQYFRDPDWCGKFVERLLDSPLWKLLPPSPYMPIPEAAPISPPSQMIAVPAPNGCYRFLPDPDLSPISAHKIHIDPKIVKTVGEVGLGTLIGTWIIRTVAGFGNAAAGVLVVPKPMMDWMQQQMDKSQSGPGEQTELLDGPDDGEIYDVYSNGRNLTACPRT
ncbi:MAG: hypothetical protein V1495_09590 [Pseudomonadota bacterium]